MASSSLPGAREHLADYRSDVLGHGVSVVGEMAGRVVLVAGMQTNEGATQQLLGLARRVDHHIGVGDQQEGANSRSARTAPKLPPVWSR